MIPIADRKTMKTLVLCLVTICVLFGIALGAMAAPNTPPSASVTVVNTSSNPVPVSGTLGISGTADVKVITPVVVRGTDSDVVPVGVVGSVSIYGTPNVSVTNSPTAILLNEEIGNEGYSKILDTSNCSTIRISFYSSGPNCAVYDASTQAGPWGPTVCSLIGSSSQVITTPPPSINIAVGTGPGPNWIAVYCR